MSRFSHILVLTQAENVNKPFLAARRVSSRSRSAPACRMRQKVGSVLGSSMRGNQRHKTAGATITAYMFAAPGMKEPTT
jgi:hypothetical protein